MWKEEHVLELAAQIPGVRLQRFRSSDKLGFQVYLDYAGGVVCNGTTDVDQTFAVLTGIQMALGKMPIEKKE